MSTDHTRKMKRCVVHYCADYPYMHAKELRSHVVMVVFFVCDSIQSGVRMVAYECLVCVCECGRMGVRARVLRCMFPGEFLYVTLCDCESAFVCVPSDVFLFLYA